MTKFGERKIDPREAAHELAESSPLSQKQAVAYVYFNTIDDPQKRPMDIFHIPERELAKEKDRAIEIVEAAKKVKQMDVEETRLRDKADILVGCGLLTENQAEAFHTYSNVSEEAASEMLDRPIEDIHKDFKRAQTKIEESREMFDWLHRHSGAEVY
jgi:hypothetical protein